MDNQEALNEVVSTTLIAERLEAEVQAIEDYWTEERMAASTPLPLEVEEETIRSLLEDEFVTPEGEQLEVESIAPDSPGEPDGSEDPEVDPLSFSTNRVTNRTILPYCTVGKLFMRFGNSNYVGTAWTIARRGVFTAGHCIFESSLGGWARSVLFVPQYHNGAEPRGRWVATRLHALNGWIQNRDFRFDLGVFEVDRAVSPSTGSLGWMANYPPNQGPYTSIGYPAGAPFNGQEMWQCRGGYINGSNPIQMHNNMTGGCSGGPWSVSRPGGFFANGINSFRYTNNPNTMYSPYFGNGMINLYNIVKGLT